MSQLAKCQKNVLSKNIRIFFIGNLDLATLYWQILKCMRPLTGRYVVIQHYSGGFSVYLSEVVFYAI